MIVVEKREILPVERYGECRCHCGSLVARIVSDGVEIKCKRCKRLVIIPLKEKSKVVY